MSILIFLLILLVLVISHEFGHFIVAKAFRIRVDEFAFGFPPRLFSKTFGETRYVFNALPIGGYVKIYGENPDEVIEDSDRARSFSAQKLWKQASVIIAGVVFNILLAWILVTMTYAIGTPTLVDNDMGYPVEHPQLTITGIKPGSPAEKAGVKGGDVIALLEEGGGAKEVTQADEVQAFLSIREGKAVHLTVTRGKSTRTLTVIPEKGIVADRAAIGISMDQVGILRLPIGKAIVEGARQTWVFTKLTAGGIYHFLAGIFVGKSDFKEVTGPVGIVGAVGDAAKLGFASVVMFTALISINLAVINLIPFPALDGGRLLFVIIEAIIRRPIPVRIANYTNIVGFGLLMLLMLVVTFHDVMKFF